jgi:hypothetical protein
MLTDDGLRALASLNEAFEMFHSYMKGLREKFKSCPENSEDRNVILREMTEFLKEWDRFMMNPVRKEAPKCP